MQHVTTGHIRSLISTGKLEQALSVLEYIIEQEALAQRPSPFLKESQEDLAILRGQLQEIEYRSKMLDPDFMAGRRVRIAQSLSQILMELRDKMDKRSWRIDASELPDLAQEPKEDVLITISNRSDLTEEEQQTMLESITQLLKHGKHSIKIERGDGG